MFNFVIQLFPDFGLNSCLINYYPSKLCTIPDHSDDEASICDHSYIVTISLGASRRMIFKSKLNGNFLCSVSLTDGQILIFTKASQSLFTHGIPVTEQPDVDEYGPRISATFRKLTQT